MRHILLPLMMLITCTSSFAETIIRIRVIHTNETDIICVNDHDTDETTLVTAMTKLAAIDPHLFTLLQVDPETPTSATLKILRIVRDAGMKNITIAPWKASYDLAISFSSTTNTFEPSRLWMYEAESDSERIRLEKIKHEKVGQTVSGTDSSQWDGLITKKDFRDRFGEPAEVMSVPGKNGEEKWIYLKDKRMEVSFRNDRFWMIAVKDVNGQVTESCYSFWADPPKRAKEP